MHGVMMLQKLRIVMYSGTILHAEGAGRDASGLIDVQGLNKKRLDGDNARVTRDDLDPSRRLSSLREGRLE